MSATRLRSHRARPRRQRPASAGFTLIEVMIAMSIMVIGTIGIVQMQRASMRSAIIARELGTATTIARSALERLKLDAVTWTAPATVDAMGNPTNLGDLDVLGNTLWLQRITAVPAMTWQRMEFPQTTNVGALNADLTASPGTDFIGLDLPTNGDITARGHYCIHMRLNWVIVGRSIRADVRVFSRNSATADVSLMNGITVACVDGTGALEPPVGTRQDQIHAVYATSVVQVTEPAF